MSLRGLQQRHMREILGNANGVAEPVTYRFKSGAPDQVVFASVRRFYRDPDAPRKPSRRACQVTLARTQDFGELAVEPGDRIVLPVAIGEPPAACVVRRVVSMDGSHVSVMVTE